MKQYIINVCASLSVVLNTLLGGSYRNTFSARAGYQAYVNDKQWAKIAVKVIDAMFWFDANHCHSEYLNEYGR